MDLFDFSRTLSKYCAVTGSEGETASFLKETFSGSGLICRIDDLGCLTVTKDAAPVQTALFIPLDLPGFLAVPETTKITRLLPLGGMEPEDAAGANLLFPDGTVLKVRSDKEKDPKVTDLFVQNAGFSLGTVCRIAEPLVRKEHSIVGRYAGSLALVALSARFCLNGMKSGTAAVFFTQSRQGRAEFCGNWCLENRPKEAWILSSCKAEGETAILALCCGKHVSHPSLCKKLKIASEDQSVALKTQVLEHGRDLSVSVSAQGIPAADLVLPVQNPNKENESVSEEALLSLEQILSLIA